MKRILSLHLYQSLQVLRHQLNLSHWACPSVVLLNPQKLNMATAKQNSNKPSNSTRRLLQTLCKFVQCFVGFQTYFPRYNRLFRFCCGEDFSKMSNYNRHIRSVHSGHEDCISCIFCDKKFPACRSDNLKRHLKTHIKRLRASGESEKERAE